MNLHEDDLIRRQSHRKTNSQDDSLNKRLPQRNTTLRRQPHRKKTSQKDNATGTRQLQMKKDTWTVRQSHNKTSSQEDNRQTTSPWEDDLSEDKLGGRLAKYKKRPQLKRNSLEDDLSGRLPHMKTTSQEDNLL